MAYRRRVFKKRFTKRKARFTRRITRRTYKKSKYDTGHWVTCNATKNVHYRTSWENETDYKSRFAVFWGTNAIGGDDEIMLQNSPEFTFWTQAFSVYKVIGVKMQFVPDSYGPNSILTERRNAHYCSIETALNKNLDDITIPYMMQQPDYKSQSAAKGWTKYVSVGKYMKKRGVIGLVETDINYSDAFSTVMQEVVGLSNGASTGTMNVTYYCYFQRPKVSLP